MLTAPRTVSPFRNEPIRDFSDPADRRSLEEALVRARAGAGGSYPLVIDGRKVRGAGTFDSINPARPREVVGTVDEASPAQVAQALDAATAAFGTWKTRSAAERADFLFRAAARIRETKDDWNALLATFENYDRVFVPWELAEPSPLRAVFERDLDGASSVLVVIGPEGGFAADEVERARDAGAKAISLGRRILRTETAALVVLAALLYARGEL